jgi:hypothetical protein
MAGFSNLEGLLNIGMNAAFGLPITYQPMLGGMANGSSLSISAIRLERESLESGSAANFEAIEINPVDLGSYYPQRGDWVTAFGFQFVVERVKQPDADGPIVIAMIQRPAQALPLNAQS